MASCNEEIIILEVPIEPPELFIPCDKTISEAMDVYLDTTWTASDIKDFIQGTWRLYSFQALHADTVSPLGTISVERQLLFNDNTIEVFEPFDKSQGVTTFAVQPCNPDFANRFFEITSDSDNALIESFLLGKIIPCNSDFVLHKNFIDRPDLFYRKVE